MSEEKKPIKLYAKVQSQQGQNPTDPKESGEVEKPVVSMYDPPAEITYIEINGKEYAPIDPNQDELWEEVEKEFKYPKTVFRTSDLTTITSAKENLKNATA